MAQSIFPIAVFVIRAVLGAVLVAAGAAKLADSRSFAATLRGLGVPLGRAPVLRSLAWSLPGLEVGAGIAVASGLWPAAVNAVVLLLMGGFTLVVIVALRRKLEVACRCFGMLSDSQFDRRGLARSALLTLLAAVVFTTGEAPWPALPGPSGVIIPVVAGYLLLALASWQAAQSLAVLHERIG